ncbi:glycerol-3-phosphate 1-O-acyltransferase PlsB [Moraxella nasovis]|uniref:glycerol-3-phosphate 1-O-acyltransferase PlsB n=1 Tax=Moraxella nasovis TaxID=2904121 RepID=UPI001F625330|nr:glycerol-3-phosphate 1-O-acyltransferase PlsB [Moraxella nasovis]UNU72545.1 glycerol-3-phosphate 1-O-acyltransferase PlsB [Moraxella nasovis]
MLNAYKKKLATVFGKNKTQQPESEQTLTDSYRKASVQGLSFVVKPTVLGDVPQIDENRPTFYVIDVYSRSNSLLVGMMTDELGLPSALSMVQSEKLPSAETSAMIFLKDRRNKRPASAKSAPRLDRLVQACLNNEQLDINLVPVTILWGRAPDKEDSLFKLLMTDEWRSPGISKQLFNISVMGRNTFIQFGKCESLSSLVSAYHEGSASDTTQKVSDYLQSILDNQRTSIVGPDLSDKRNITGKILASATVQEAIDKEAIRINKPIAEIKKQAAGYLSEITSDYSHSLVRFFERFLNRLWTKLYDGVEVRHFERVRKLATDYQIVYVPCHRSHIDYLLLSYIIYRNGLRVPHVAAGENLNIPIVGEILRSGGAFFMRRSFRGNELYSTVFKEYVHTLMQRAVPIEYFIEGGRSRSGRLLPPKLGMLAMTVNSYLREPAKPVAFIPTYISYERIMEGATYVGELKGKPKQSENLLGLIKTTQKIERIFGTVHLSFGEPLYLTDFMQKFDVVIDDEATECQDAKRYAMINNIGVKIMQNINKAAVVNPVSLLALVLLSTPKSALAEDQCLEQIALYQRIAINLPYDVDTHITTMTPRQILNYGIRLKLIDRTPHLLGDMIRVADKQAPLLSYFKNNILHVFILASFIGSLVQRNSRIHQDELDDVVQLLYPFLQAELFLKTALRNVPKLVNQVLTLLIDEGVVVDLGGGIVGAPEGNSAAYQKLIVLASPAQQSLERYVMALALLAKQGSGKLTAEQTVNLCYVLGQRVSVLYSDDLPDMFDKALFTSFIDTLRRLGYVWQVDGEPELHFDERIDEIEKHASFVLDADMMQLLAHVASLNTDEIDLVITQMNKKRKFGIKK